ncbi:MAG: hypothetical protein JNK72_02935 [Myxococcales bacterium]|nr:hypothetical protein [Myxococcales bacterium]
MTDSAGRITIEHVVELLAEVGEVDAGAEVLEAWQLRAPNAAARVRLQALLFDAADPGPAQRHARLGSLPPSLIDELAREGALLEANTLLGVLVRAFPDDALWREKQQRLVLVLSPLPGGQGDPRREAVDAMVARGALQEAFVALRELCREGRDAVLEQRAEILRGLLFEPAHTRPYRALDADEAPRVISPHLRGATAPDLRKTPVLPLSKTGFDEVGVAGDANAWLRQSIAMGDLDGALREASTLLARSPSPRLIRLREALGNLRALLRSSEPGGPGDEAVEHVSRLMREGRLREARDLTRSLLTQGSTEMAARLSPRLADLDVVLDGSVPTPSPPKPRNTGEHQAVVQSRIEVAIERDRQSEHPPALRDVARGNVTAQHRKVVRLGAPQGVDDKPSKDE